MAVWCWSRCWWRCGVDGGVVLVAGWRCGVKDDTMLMTIWRWWRCGAEAGVDGGVVLMAVWCWSRCWWRSGVDGGLVLKPVLMAVWCQVAGWRCGVNGDTILMAVWCQVLWCWWRCGVDVGVVSGGVARDAERLHQPVQVLPPTHDAVLPGQSAGLGVLHRWRAAVLLRHRPIPLTSLPVVWRHHPVLPLWRICCHWHCSVSMYPWGICHGNRVYTHICVCVLIFFITEHCTQRCDHWIELPHVLIDVLVMIGWLCVLRWAECPDSVAYFTVYRMK